MVRVVSGYCGECNAAFEGRYIGGRPALFPFVVPAADIRDGKDGCSYCGSLNVLIATEPVGVGQ